MAQRSDGTTFNRTTTVYAPAGAVLTVGDLLRFAQVLRDQAVPANVPVEARMVSSSRLTGLQAVEDLGRV